MIPPDLQKPTYTYRATVGRVVDGDTMDVFLDVGFYTTLKKRLRFLGIDTWELTGSERELGFEAKARLEELLSAAERVYVQTEMDAEGKYGRVLAWVWCVNPDGSVICVNKALLEEGHGNPT